MHPLLILFLATVASLLAGAGVCHLIPKLGPPGRALGAAMCRAPGIDLVLMYFIVGPWVAGAIVAGWAGIGISVLGQYAGLLIWIALHEAAHPDARRGPRIHGTLNRLVGGWRNHTAVWLTSLAVPAFWGVRFLEVFVYPPITWTARLPKYRHADWVQVSRQKFDGLIGYDLIWCLYCDWMTGVWSLGSEMLRNVESFWCPIRFYSEKKCANCVVDFPDINDGWIPADGGMGEVAALLEDKYGGRRDAPWFGHPVRLTVNGKDDDARAAARDKEHAS